MRKLLIIGLLSFMGTAAFAMEEIKNMTDEMFAANKDWLPPQFKK